MFDFLTYRLYFMGFKTEPNLVKIHFVNSTPSALFLYL
ncbi:hypothetical protein AQPE_3795 [Aquipluma nitroreducens]|uniref:Uncharacterized protein n=1 Tax=Aquipluma nitroreducens TaxID=2010828 RepID=A0A5K7SDQ0_9BACT|nr:hypothetical protein AQPE_3795 [Aquipluma nitroreducens]